MAQSKQRQEGGVAMMHPNAKPWTKAEKARAERMKEIIGCICCWLAFGRRSPCQEIDHLISGNKRMGHWYSIPLCRKHHQGKGLGGLWTSVADGSKAFAAVHGSRIDLWLKVQHILKLSDDLPPTKILPRRAA
jgi:hypothetical protein